MCSALATSLRPDFYEFFPLYSRRELQQRLDAFGVAIATGMEPLNILTAWDDPRVRGWLERHVESDPSRRAVELAAVLSDSRVSPAVASAVAQAQRHRFLGPEHQWCAYLNASVVTRAHSALSSPGLVCLMVERLGPRPGEVILEVGSGAGFHLACLSGLLKDACALRGVEIDPELAALSREVLRQQGVVAEISVADAYAGEHSREADRVFVTHASDRGIASFGPGTSASYRPLVLQHARPLTRAEFESEPRNSWLWREYGSFDGYLAGDWAWYCCLETLWWVGGERRARVLSRLYDVTFVYPIEAPQSSVFEKDDTGGEVLALLYERLQA